MAALSLCALLSFVARKRSAALSLALAIAAAFSFGAWRAQLSSRSALAPLGLAGGGAPLFCEGIVEGRPRMKGWGVSFDMALRSCGTTEDGAVRARGAVRVNARFVPDRLADGERVRALLEIKRPRVFRNAGSFDYGRYLLSLGIGAVATARSPVARVEARPRWSPSRAMAGARGRVSASIDAALDLPGAAIVKALAIGDRSLITPELRDGFARSGLAHLLALSGLHVGYVALAIYLLVRLTIGLVPRLVSRIPARAMAAWVTLPAVWGYVLFTGCPISAVRAAVMLSVWLAGVILMRRPDAINSIAIAVTAIVAVSPESVLSVSFQLSVVAVAGIALIAAPMIRALKKRGEQPGIAGRVLRPALGLAAVSFAACAATAPLVAYHFKTFTAVGLFANMLAVPLTGIVIEPLVLAATALSAAASGAAVPLWKGAGLAAGWLIGMASFSSEAGAPLIGRWAPSVAELALAYAALCCAAMWKRLPWRAVLVSSLAIAMFTDVLYYKALPAFDRRLTVTFFDVGQGDSALVRFPGGETLLIDGGGLKRSSIDVGKEVIAPALLCMGVRRIDRVLLSHPHYDHYAGLASVLREFGPAKVWTSGLDAPQSEEAEWGAFLAAVRESGSSLEMVGEGGVEMESGGATIAIEPAPDSGSDDFNDTSLVARLSFGRRSFLFMGDLTGRGERALLTSMMPLESSVLKVGHHGSADASSADFLAAVRPEVAVVSAGMGNPYGFPHRDALARLEAAAGRVMRTDEHGAVAVSTDGEDLRVSSFSGGGG
ncbi:MAG: DNA internalization-related competence protein ComEC/Rec2 [Proteobacteria bacterium]|nr:DNA internalization-related competence protein ComEC/Rec2 [Pseudomonadota bacterium]